MNQRFNKTESGREEIKSRSRKRDRLGLVRGFKVILDVERCANVEDLRTLAVQFLDQVETHQGQAHARQMRRAIGARA